MPLLLFDLDNTLLPRDAAFRAWAQDFLDEHRLPPGDLSWFTTIDGGGYVPRGTVLGAIKRRYGLDHSTELLLAHYRRGINSHIHCPASHIDALHTARAAGWTLGIVSNGGTRPQLEKIRRTGLGPLVDGWVISEEARCLKPDPQIFEIAAQRCGVPPTADWTSHTWMIGDYAPADIAGAEVTGLRSVWLHHGRPWAESGYRPTLSAAGLPEAVGLVLTARNAPSLRPNPRRSVRPAVATADAAPVQLAGAPAAAPASERIRHAGEYNGEYEIERPTGRYAVPRSSASAPAPAPVLAPVLAPAPTPVSALGPRPAAAATTAPGRTTAATVPPFPANKTGAAAVRRVAAVRIPDGTAG
ncbi:HAD family hydrolase [Kitasatospora atroaurantiaca]